MATARAINHHQFANHPEAASNSMSSKPILSNSSFPQVPMNAPEDSRHPRGVQ